MVGILILVGLVILFFSWFLKDMVLTLALTGVCICGYLLGSIWMMNRNNKKV